MEKKAEVRAPQMEDCQAQSLASSTATVEKEESLVIDIDSLAQLADMSSGSPKMTRALSRKGSSRMEPEDPSKRLPPKVVCPPADNGENKKRFNRLPAVHPRRILLFFATLSCVGTMILIYCTLAISHRGSS